MNDPKEDYRRLWEIHTQLYSGGVEREAILDLLEFLMEKVDEAAELGKPSPRRSRS